jgi:hypothetical protein
MFWFRIELDTSGKLIKSERVADAGERDGKPSVYYFRAPGAESAEAMAFREYHRLRQQARREAYKRLGKCKCGRSRDRESAADSQFKLCPVCRSNHTKDWSRGRLRAKGVVVPTPSKAIAFVDRRNEEKRILLEEVKDQFLRLSMGQFGKWLNDRIAEVSPKAPPQLRVVGSRKG